jgi:hypothetical protein
MKNCNRKAIRASGLPPARLVWASVDIHTRMIIENASLNSVVNRYEVCKLYVGEDAVELGDCVKRSDCKERNR